LNRDVESVGRSRKLHDVVLADQQLAYRRLSLEAARAISLKVLRVEKLEDDRAFGSLIEGLEDHGEIPGPTVTHGACAAVTPTDLLSFRPVRD